MDKVQWSWGGVIDIVDLELLKVERVRADLFLDLIQIVKTAEYPESTRKQSKLMINSAST